MCFGHRFTRLEHVVDGGTDFELASGLELAREIVPRQELHHHERGAVVELAYVDHACDVLAVNAHRRSRFAQKARASVRVLAQLGREELHGHALFQLSVEGGYDVPHPTFAEEAFHPVLTG
jgi:hypothetical protein